MSHKRHLLQQTCKLSRRLHRRNVQEVLLMQRNRASTLSVEIVQNTAQMFDGLHLKRPAACEWPWPSRSTPLHHLIGHISLPLSSISILRRFRNIDTCLAKNKTSRALPGPSGGMFVITRQTLLGPANPCTNFDDSIFSHSRKNKGV